MNSPSNDETLVRRTLAGDTAAYGQLVRRWSARILAFCHSRTRHAAAAEDLAQEAMVRGFKALPTLQQPDKFGTWLCGIAYRACLDWLKSRKRSEVSLSTLQGEEEREVLLAAEPEQDKAEESDQLLTEVARLPETYRETLMLFYYEEMSYKEIAALLEVSTATVNARLTRARGILRQRMSETRRES